jgi:hypothetical protein
MRPTIVAIALLSSACVLRPVDGAVAAPGDPLALSGFDSQPGSPLVIQDHQSGSCESGDTVTCGIEGTNEDGTPECPAGNCDNNRVTAWLF